MSRVNDLKVALAAHEKIHEIEQRQVNSDLGELKKWREKSDSKGAVLAVFGGVVGATIVMLVQRLIS